MVKARDLKVVYQCDNTKETALERYDGDSRGRIRNGRSADMSIVRIMNARGL